MIDTFRPAAAARAARVGTDLVLLHLERGTYFTLNASGAFVWERLDGARSCAEISTEMAGAFDVEPETARRDVHGLLDELVAQGLAEPATTPGVGTQSSNAGS